jgi:hypothetical protein
MQKIHIHLNINGVTGCKETRIDTEFAHATIAALSIFSVRTFANYILVISIEVTGRSAFRTDSIRYVRRFNYLEHENAHWPLKAINIVPGTRFLHDIACRACKHYQRSSNKAFHSRTHFRK